MRHVLFILLGCYYFLSSAKGQNVDYPEIGKPCPEFRLNNVYYFKKGYVTNSDFKGKWLVLDLFSTGCVSCFESFPKVNQLSIHFKESVQFFLIGYDDQYIRSTYDRFRKKQNLNLPVAYDTATFYRFGVKGVPHVMLVDPDGIVRAITSSLSGEDIQQFLDGQDPNLLVKPNIEEFERLKALYDPMKPLLIGNNGGNDTDFLFRSLLAPWKNGIVGGGRSFISSMDGNMKQVVGYGLKDLYLMAYGDTAWPYFGYVPSSYGKYWFEPVLEVADSSDFTTTNNSAMNKYNYSVIIPKHGASTQVLKEVMQRDLLNYFNKYAVSVENRLMPCWSLVSEKDAIKKLKSKGGVQNTKSNLQKDGLTLMNYPIASLIGHLTRGLFAEGPPLVDDTNIRENIDIEINAVLSNFSDLKKELNRYGLDLRLTRKPMQVVVIRDR